MPATSPGRSVAARMSGRSIDWPPTTRRAASGPESELNVLRKAPTPRQVLAPIALLLMGCSLAFGAGPASASHVSCGDTITADTRLDGDLVDCPSNGIVIGANNVTLDLNDHTVTGNGKRVKRCGRREFCDVGLLNDGHDGVTVRHGSVRDFGVGVFVGRARHNRVLRVSSSRNFFFGFVIAESARSVVRDSSGSGNPAPEGDGIGLFGSRHIRVLDSSFRRNGLGMHVADSTNNVIKRNRFSRNGPSRNGPGIIIEADHNQVRRNRCARNGVCVLVAPGSRNVIAWNHSFRDKNGFALEKGRGNVLARNVVIRARGDGIYLGLLEPPIGGVNNVVRRNLVRGSGDAAFQVNPKDRHALLQGNIASGAADDGFNVKGRSATLVNNRAVRNTDLGIQAAFGVIDGGGNKAHGNGNPLQCTNIFCK
jgi:large repetitive protein